MAWSYATLRLPDAATWAALRPLLPAGSDVLEMGTAYAPLPADAPEGTAPAALPGWWVSLATREALPAALAQHRAAAPAGVPVLGAVPVPREVSLRQLLLALRDGGWISHAEALAAACTGAMPAPLVQLLAGAVAGGQMTQAAADDAELTWAAMYTAVRTDPIWSLFVAGGIATATQVDGLFQGAAAR